jgi:hypothetical protein
MAEVRQAAQAALVVMRGGKRAGSGRKPRKTRRPMVLLSPAARTRLEEPAKQTGSLSAAVEKAVMANGKHRLPPSRKSVLKIRKSH